MKQKIVRLVWLGIALCMLGFSNDSLTFFLIGCGSFFYGCFIRRKAILHRDKQKKAFGIKPTMLGNM